MKYVLRTKSLSKQYKNKLAVDGVCMNIEKGEVYGFVGENGSGKTTIIRLICALGLPTNGSIELFGVDANSVDALNVRRKMGAIVENPAVYLNMSAMDNMKLQAEILGIKDEQKMRDTLALVGLSYLEKDKKTAGNFSLGMRQRLGIAMALLGEPEFLILDEPMNGLDPAGIVEMRELIQKLNKEKGITFLISSHILSELSLVATKYGFISKGKLIKEVSAEQLNKECTPSIYFEAEDNETLFALLRSFDIGEVTREGAGVRVYTSVEFNEVLIKVSAECKIKVVNNASVGLEEYYLSLMGGGNNA